MKITLFTWNYIRRLEIAGCKNYCVYRKLQLCYKPYHVPANLSLNLEIASEVEILMLMEIYCYQLSQL